jgi:hypothetical protein
MRLLLLLVIALMIFPARATPNPVPSYRLGLYGDAAGTVDAIYTDGSGTVTIYVVFEVVMPGDEYSGLQFSVVAPPCFNAVYVGESSVYTPIGNSQTGVFFLLDTFTYGSHNILTITYSAQGTTPACCWGEPQLPASWDYSIGIEGVWINPNEPRNCVAPVESSTWGAIKAMYR